MKEKNKKSGCAIFAIAATVVVALFIILVIVLANTVGKSIPNDKEKKANNSEIQAIIDATNMTIENATEAYNVFKQVGVCSVIYTVTQDTTLDDMAAEGTKGYRIKTEFSNNVILYVMDGKIYSLRYVDYDYYINGKVEGYFYDQNGKLIAGTYK